MKNKSVIIVFLLIVLSVAGYLYYSNFNTLVNIPRWSIGMFEIDEYLNIKEKTENPILANYTVGEPNSYFVADPFVFQYDEKYYMFYENGYNNRGGGGKVLLIMQLAKMV